MGNVNWSDARAALKHVFWIGGASRGGKSTIRKMLVEEFGFVSYHGDEEVFRHLEYATQQQSPALWTMQRLMKEEQFSEWILAKSAKDMADFFRDTGREDFDFVVPDLLAMPNDTRIVVDIFATYPAGVANVAVPENAVLLIPTDSFQRETIIEGDRKGETEPRENYIEGQRLFSEIVREHAKRLNITVIETGGRLEIEEMYESVCRYFGLRNND